MIKKIDTFKDGKPSNEEIILILNVLIETTNKLENQIKNIIKSKLNNQGLIK